MKELLIRLSSPTPKFFKKIQRIGLIITAIGTALVAAPVSLPASLVTLSGYLITAGLVAASVAQIPVDDDSVLPTK